MNYNFTNCNKLYWQIRIYFNGNGIMYCIDKNHNEYVWLREKKTATMYSRIHTLFFSFDSFCKSNRYLQNAIVFILMRTIIRISFPYTAGTYSFLSSFVVVFFFQRISSFIIISLFTLWKSILLLTHEVSQCVSSVFASIYYCVLLVNSSLLY